jgi:type II secretory pathway pseudopilin PulG
MALVTSGILLGAVVSSFISQQHTYSRQEQASEMTLSARAALDMIIRDIRTTGYGVPASGLEEWIDWVSDREGNRLRFTEPIRITQRENEADTLMLVGCFDAPIARLRADAEVGDDRLNLRYDRGTQAFNTTKRKIFYLGRNENGIVTKTASQARRRRSIRIDTDPATPGNQGVDWSYRGGDDILELLKVITYAIKVDNVNYEIPTPILTRDENTGGGAQPLAEHVEDLRITRNGDTLIVALTVQTAQPEPNYTHPTEGDGYRRLTLTSAVKPRGVER